jgi:phosphatidylinositol mannoside-binding LppM-like protein
VLPRRVSRIAALALLAMLAMLSLSGCVRVRAALAVSEDDLVSGDVIIAALPRQQGDQGPVLKVLPELADKVHAEKYSEDGYVGQKLTISGLRFSDLTVLAESITDSKQYRLNLRRSGDLVSLAGSIDLTQVSQDRVDVQLKIAFPGTINRTNGLNDGGTISWKPKAGAVTEFGVTAQYTDTSGVSWTKWVAIVASSAVGVALIVLGLALLGHRRHQQQLAAERAQAS